MKEKLIILAAALAAVVSCKPLPSQSYEIYGLVSPVKSMEVTAYKGEYSYNSYFGKKGVITKVDHYNTDGSLRFTENFTYDKRNRMINNLVVNADGVTEGIYTYNYDGKFISESRALGMNTEELYRWENTNDGHHIVKSVFYADGIPNSTTYNEYDGLVCHQKTVSADDSTDARTGVMTFWKEDKVASIESGDMNFRIEYDANGLPVHTWNTCLDSTGDIFYEDSLEEHPDRYYKYEFDKRGNWTERTEYFHPDSTAVGAVERMIMY